MAQSRLLLKIQLELTHEDLKYPETCHTNSNQVLNLKKPNGFVVLNSAYRRVSNLETI